jgi:hypothetical protein
MNRFVAALAAFLTLPISLSLVAQAAAAGHPQGAVAAACAGCAASAVIGWVLAQVSLAMRSLHAPRERRWNGRERGGW